MCPICRRPVVRDPFALPGGELTHAGCGLRSSKPLAVCPPPPSQSSRIRRNTTVCSTERQPHSRGSTLGGSRYLRTKTHLPSVQALVATDDGLLDQELRCLAVREQAAAIRALAERIDCLATWRGSAEARAQLVEELARLGCRALEAAALMSKKVDPAPESGWSYLQSTAPLPST
jgi:hypothetical protein